MTALIMPALLDMVVFHSLSGHSPPVHALSLLTSGVLLLIYLAGLVFSLITHRELLSPGPPP